MKKKLKHEVITQRINPHIFDERACLRKWNYISSKKWCFVAKEVKGGWKLKLAYGSKDYPVRGIVFKNMEEIQQLTHDGKVVFIHLKNSKYPVK